LVLGSAHWNFLGPDWRWWKHSYHSCFGAFAGVRHAKRHLVQLVYSRQQQLGRRQLGPEKKQADLRIALAFGAPSIVSVFLTRYWLLPLLPEAVLGIAKGAWLMGLFALLMVFAARSMIRGSSAKVAETSGNFSLKKTGLVVAQGLGVGLLTGLLGAGGGFIIIPVLVQVTGLPMKKAIGTTLVIIAANSLIGFGGDLSNFSPNWPFLLLFSGLSILGIFIGIGLSQRIPGAKLKSAFGWFVLIMGLGMLVKQGLELL